MGPIHAAQALTDSKISYGISNLLEINIYCLCDFAQVICLLYLSFFICKKGKWLDLL